ncbi:MAG TPA: hypothetical protein VJ935_02635, partial [Acidimicrobiia bacterium]|nr:hypothetical protein [Acidimicrobiia bacterium]
RQATHCGDSNGCRVGVGIPTAAMAQTQDGLVNVMIGDVTILEDVDIALERTWSQTSAQA